ncbi:hypothetical protein [Polyangium aurulentum]|uniref:hypothetical protein n=1 Tax=Polyangium aurulentum TaxID=2567896 RepID=UPI0010AE26F6|nr:hypothetical protein [Polyangium aurulentum]UQA55541.1 hypothetical protein E8A73_029880 [Polyangium aurulentum]
MLSIRISSAIVLGAGLLCAGCLGSADDFDGFAETPHFEAQGGPSGSTGINGASPAAYHANVGKLLAALSVAAADPGDPSLVNPAIVSTGLLATSGGREVLHHAAQCALPAGTQLSRGIDIYQGGGILSTTSAWLTRGLSIGEQEDVLTCMIAHLNPFGAHVPVFLSGASVAGSADASVLDFNTEEAIWQARIPAPGAAPVYYAWPRADLDKVCGLLTNLAWITRICGGPLNTCGVQVRYDSATACTGADGVFSCDGKRTIETRLEDGALCLLHLGL